MNKAEILIIDDEVQIRKLLEITLQSNNYTITEAATAKNGMIMAANHPPDLIILDLGLPDDDGHNVLQKLRQWYTNPIIILSVQSNEQDIIKALDNGANDYLPKPFRTGELLARIRSALRSSILEDSDPIPFRDTLYGARWAIRTTRIRPFGSFTKRNRGGSAAGSNQELRRKYYRYKG